MTQALDASDDQTYFSIAGKILGSTVFAYGCSGYGTLQEYMILDRYIDEIRPDHIEYAHVFHQNGRFEVIPYTVSLHAIKAYDRFGHVSWEWVLSGLGLRNLYKFLRDTGRGEEPPWLAQELRERDPGAVITQAALGKRGCPKDSPSKRGEFSELVKAGNGSAGCS